MTWHLANLKTPRWHQPTGRLSIARLRKRLRDSASRWFRFARVTRYRKVRSLSAIAKSLMLA